MINKIIKYCNCY